MPNFGTKDLKKKKAHDRGHTEEGNSWKVFKDFFCDLSKFGQRCFCSRLPRVVWEKFESQMGRISQKHQVGLEYLWRHIVANNGPHALGKTVKYKKCSRKRTRGDLPFHASIPRIWLKVMKLVSDLWIRTNWQWHVHPQQLVI